MSHRLNKWVRLRIILVSGAVCLLMVINLGRIINLKFWQGERLEDQAQREYQKFCPVLPIRGSIMDRRGTELAISTMVKSLGAHPRRLTDKGKLSRELAPMVGMSAARIQSLLESDRPFVWIKRHLTPEQAEDMAAWEAQQQKQARAAARRGQDEDADSWRAVYLIPEAKRYYPFQSLAGPILGFCDIDGRGLEGLEKQFDDHIYGKPSKCLNLLDARGHIIVSSEKHQTDNITGDNLVLTIDRTIQYIAEKELAQGVKKWNAAGGLAMVVVPQTGEILAMAQTPGFDPNNYKNTSKDHYQNRNVTIALEPGSTFKIFTIAAALEAKAVRPQDAFHCGNGKWDLGKAGIIHDVHPYGSLPVSDIIKKSSNIGAAKVGMRLGAAKLDHFFRAFGFGSRTGICYAGESYGLVRHAQNCRALIDKVTVAFGQGISTTAVQLAMALSVFGNEGTLMAPLLVKEIIDQKGEVMRRFHPTAVRQVTSPVTARQVLAMMKTVTLPGGTGTEAVPPGFTVAGKTGTAQKIVNRAYSKSKYNSLFIGLVPAERPALAIVVVVDEPKGAIYGGVVAAPIFREIAAQSLRFLGHMPGPEAVPEKPEVIETRQPIKPGVPEAAASRKAPAPQDKMECVTAPLAATMACLPFAVENLQVLPDFTGMTMRQVVSTLQRLGVRCQVKGRGLAVAQTPEPGTALTPDIICRVTFKP